MKKIALSVVFVSAVSAGGEPALAGGGAVCSVFDPTWRNQHDSTQTAITRAVDGYSSAVASENAQTAREVTSAIAVLTAQVSASDSQLAATDLKANEANATAVTANMARLAVSAAYETYGDAGQPPDNCSVVARLSDFSQSVTVANAAARDFVTDASIDVRPGGTPNVDEVLRRRLASASEVTLDVRRSLLDPNASPEDVSEFINNLTGLPIQKASLGGGGVSASAGGGGQAIQNLQAARLEAFQSPALTSLGFIRSIRAGSTAGPENSTNDVREHLDWMMSRYGGGAEYEQWAATMVTKSEPGIMKEIARIRSLAMTVRQLREESTDRMTVLVGTMVASEASQ